MRRTTLLWLVLAAICGGILFHTSQQVTDGRTRLAALEEDTRKENETIRVLQAEWSYLNQPDRLEKLSRQYLYLAPLKGRQFAKIEDVAERPAPVAAETPAAVTPETPAAAVTGQKPAAVAAVPVVQKPAPSTAPVVFKPSVLAQDKPAAEKPPIVRIRSTSPAKTAPAQPRLTSQTPHKDFNALIRSLGVQ